LQTERLAQVGDGLRWDAAKWLDALVAEVGNPSDNALIILRESIPNGIQLYRNWFCHQSTSQVASVQSERPHIPVQFRSMIAHFAPTSISS
jgi:hypothetical protein